LECVVRVRLVKAQGGDFSEAVKHLAQGLLISTLLETLNEDIVALLALLG